MGTSFNNPMRRPLRSFYRESSQLRSPRDSDVTMRVWQKNRSLEQNSFAMSQAIEQMQRELNRLRRRASAEGGFGSCQRMTVKSKILDVLICHTLKWDSGSETDIEGEEDIPVATNFESRHLTSETINGVTYTYTDYTDIGDGFNETRTSTESTADGTETQIVTPCWYENCVIMVQSIDVSGVLYDDTINEPYDLKKIEDSSRCWAKVVDAEEEPAPAPMAMMSNAELLERIVQLENQIQQLIRA